MLTCPCGADVPGDKPAHPGEAANMYTDGEEYDCPVCGEKNRAHADGELAWFVEREP